MREEGRGGACIKRTVELSVEYLVCWSDMEIWAPEQSDIEYPSHQEKEEIAE